MPAPITIIDDVIARLDEIIAENLANNDALGYFPVLYRRVTVKVKEGIEAGFFADGQRMERLDVIFAKRYIDAYDAFKDGTPCTHVWLKAFDLADQYWPIVLQHLMVGINAHIALDLGIAAAETQRGKSMVELREDFERINEILASLVTEVQENLVAIWPRLSWVLRKTGTIDDVIVDFGMELARNDAWRFAEQLHAVPKSNWPTMIASRDQKVAVQADHITAEKSWILQLATRIIRLGERGTVREKIGRLMG
ncbi:MAG: DUF5995 family protein [Bacteroidota bacterium]